MTMLLLNATAAFIGALVIHGMIWEGTEKRVVD